MPRPTVKKTAVPNAPGVRRVIRTHDDGRTVERYESRIKKDGGWVSVGQFDTLEAARAAQTTAKASKQQGSFVAPSAGRVPFLSVAEAWLARQDVQPTTAARTRSIVMTDLAPLHAVPVRGLDYQRLDAFVAEYKKDHAPRTVRKTMGIVGNILKDAERRKLVVGNAVGLLQLPKVTTTDRLWLTEADVRALVEAVRASHGDKFATLVLFAAYTGARAGEIAGLRVSDLNLRARSVRIARTAQYVDSAWHIGPPKTAKSLRTIGGLTTELVAALRELVALAPGTDYVFGWVAEDGTSTPYNQRNFLRRVFSPALEAVGLPTGRNGDGFGFHDLRHFHASLCIARGMTAHAVAARLGHSSTALVWDTYGHAWDQDADELVALFDASVAAGKAAQASNVVPLRVAR